MIEEIKVAKIQDLLSKVNEAYCSWSTTTIPWFRGEPRETEKPLCPKVFRDNYDENLLLQQFRMKAPSSLEIQIPQQGHTDQWLFLAQHAGLPTRLLDWTEGLLIALHFALYSEDKYGCTVWMLNPIKLNQISSEQIIPENHYPLTWFAPELDTTIWIRRLLQPDKRTKGLERDYLRVAKKILKSGKISYNLGNQNIRAAWEPKSNVETIYPVAIHPTAIHQRITVQKSTFTIWGSNKSSLCDMVDSNILRKFVIEGNDIPKFQTELLRLGISHSTLFPDMDNLAKELSYLFKIRGG